MEQPREQEAFAQFTRARTGAVAPPGPLRARRMKAIDPDSISPFDMYFREHAAGLAYDWRLLAAMAWKESRFDSTVTSDKGAMGIVQIMPRTWRVTALIRAAPWRIAFLRRRATWQSSIPVWLRAVPDRDQRLRFVLASYNAGPGHIIDAARLAQQLGLDPARWEGHVERAVLLLAKPRHFMQPDMRNGYCKGSQVFRYVRGVLAVNEQLRQRTPQPKAKR
ncbi:MAG: transglycosylase SLT domain-containing protein [Flavobacteriales bacterium]|nr:transglycosylase SLT domain-containing protein [Flavobacteriales bacterium]